MRIGIDFDNTLVNYTNVFAFYVRKMIGSGGIVDLSTKDSIRSSIRSLPDGERVWTRLQCKVYGEGVMEAHFADGVITFLLGCKKNNVPVSIISHKTKYCAEGKKHNLHAQAFKFLEINSFFHKTGILTDTVFFEETRSAKLLRIKQQKCTHFIDDLIDVFRDKGFPKNTVRMLYSKSRSGSDPDFLTFASWNAIQNYIFQSNEKH